ncbi:MAG: decaprenyl-phosphate phosphoribosyltransferase [Candidatus Hydrogenedens sp.]|nr:decaprenyl-phosphate phosphoribosyltransferase [Candidatus Hydrogenedentota bacterium]NLF56777.1 decaprenyl-phosphate phosphoribosyltransferase [Candidatus Hydrogenedens sp.]
MGGAGKMMVRLLRVYQWPKNLLVLLPLLFAQEMGDLRADLRAFAAFAAFCLASSATYIINDLRDLEQDRQHPEKQFRPLASGQISPAPAVLLSLLLLGCAVLLGIVAGKGFLVALALYLALTLSYSFLLKHVFLVDVLAVSLGFVLRAMAGALAIDVTFSNWLVVCTLFLALFLSLGKRRHEIFLLERDAGAHRAVLEHYTIGYIDQLLLLVGGGALITYTIYTCSPEVVDRVGSDKMYMTLPFVVYGLARYLWLVREKEAGGDPSGMLLSDLPIAVSVALWVMACAAILYF